MIRLRLWTFALACMLATLTLGRAHAATPSEPPAAGEALLQPTSRVLFFGDSITLQGGVDHPRSWVNLIRQGLKEAHPDWQQAPTLIPLGGSTETVARCIEVEQKSREKSVIWSALKYDLKTELDQKADVLVIMLGVYDVLAPEVQDTEEGYAQWVASYRTLIEALKARCQPRIVAIATPTPCTADPLSPRNRVLFRMTEEIVAMAKAEGYVVLPMRKTAWALQARARSSSPSAQLTVDHVHPSKLGHVAIAAGMLRGLGEAAAAQSLIDEHLPEAPGALSYTWRPIRAKTLAATQKYELQVFPGDHQVTLRLPEGWTAAQTASTPAADYYHITGLPRHRFNTVTLTLGEQSQALKIPAPWLVAVFDIGEQGWRDRSFDAKKGWRPLDGTIRSGADFWEKLPTMQVKDGVPLNWTVHTGSQDYGDFGDADSVDFAALTYYTPKVSAYGMRWVYSPTTQSVTVKAGHRGFGVSHLSMWLNGKVMVEGESERLRATSHAGTLHRGWNLLSFKSNFLLYQWIVSVQLLGPDGKALENLHYSALPPDATAN